MWLGNDFKTKSESAEKRVIWYKARDKKWFLQSIETTNDIFVLIFQEKEKFIFFLQFLKWKHFNQVSSGFHMVLKSNWFCINTTHNWLKTLTNSRHFFILSEVKPKQIETLSHSFSCVSHHTCNYFEFWLVHWIHPITGASKINNSTVTR